MMKMGSMCFVVRSKRVLAWSLGPAPKFGVHKSAEGGLIMVGE